MTTVYENIVAALKGKPVRNVKHATTATLAGGVARIAYHDTYIISATSDGTVMLDTGGWPSKTTMERMQDYLPEPYRLRGSFMRGGKMPKNARAWLVGRKGYWGTEVVALFEDAPGHGESYWVEQSLQGGSRGYEWRNDGIQRQTCLFSTTLPYPFVTHQVTSDDAGSLLESVALLTRSA